MRRALASHSIPQPGLPQPGARLRQEDDASFIGCAPHAAVRDDGVGDAHHLHQELDDGHPLWGGILRPALVDRDVQVGWAGGQDGLGAAGV